MQNRTRNAVAVTCSAPRSLASSWSMVADPESASESTFTRSNALFGLVTSSPLFRVCYGWRLASSVCDSHCRMEESALAFWIPTANKVADSGQAESVGPTNDVYEACPLRHY